VKKMAVTENRIIYGDCLEVLPKLPKAKMIFADPPDNLGMKYDGFKDEWATSAEYIDWLCRISHTAIKHCNIFWLSYYYQWTAGLIGQLQTRMIPWQEMFALRLFLWRFTFGQHRDTDCGNGYRPILRIKRPGAIIYPDAIRVPSKRQTLYNDKRANPKGRVPDDVWEFPRVCGTFKERRKWHPNQHPEVLIERIVKFSCKPGDLVIDMFAGTGTVNRVCKRLGISCIGIEISEFYCEQITKEQNIPVEIIK